MCDTMVIQGSGSSVFGKNSDRDPGELQILQYSTNGMEELISNPCPEKLPKYLDGPYRNLLEHADTLGGTIPAFLSRPVWIWGAEMGVNIHGLSIGNEAVFSKEKTAPGGLLGMDILRLALHTCTAAREALDFITGVTGEIGQGGNGSYSGKLEYHNSYLIKDPAVAFVLETSGRHWVYRRVKGYGSISNAYTLGNDFDGADADTRSGFRGKGENGLFTLFARGRTRQAHTSNRLAEAKPEAAELREILRSHPSGGAKIAKNMSSVCMHSRGIVSSETTASMIVDYRPEGIEIWVTGAPFPCLSLYKPLVFDGLGTTPFAGIDAALRYGGEAAAFSRRMLARSREERLRIRECAETYENRFERMLRSGGDRSVTCSACLELEKEFRREVAG